MLTANLIVTGMVALFFALFLLAFIWALNHRQLQDTEPIKFKVFEDGEDFRDTI